MIFKELRDTYLVGVGYVIPINDWNYIPTLSYFTSHRTCFKFIVDSINIGLNNFMSENFNTDM